MSKLNRHVMGPCYRCLSPSCSHSERSVYRFNLNIFQRHYFPTRRAFCGSDHFIHHIGGVDPTSQRLIAITGRYNLFYPKTIQPPSIFSSLTSTSKSSASRAYVLVPVYRSLNSSSLLCQHVYSSSSSSYAWFQGWWRCEPKQPAHDHFDLLICFPAHANRSSSWSIRLPCGR